MVEILPEIRFLSVEDVQRLHHLQLGRYGGGDGLRDENMLASAVFQPQQTFGGEYVYSGIHAMASAYWHGLTMNHPFVDGNKRVGFLSCFVFLATNGYRLVLHEHEAIETGRQVAQGNVARELLARIIQTNTVAI